MPKDTFLYMQVYMDLKEKIEQNVLPEGTKLPTDEELKEEYGVSIITVKKALTMLKEEGVVQRVPGVGSFVHGKKRAEEPGQTKQEVQAEPMPDSAAWKRIGLVLEHVSDAFGLDFVYHLDQMLYQKGYRLVVRFSYYSREKETEEIGFLMDSDISGLVVMPCHGVYYNSKILKLILEDFPVVMVDKKLEGISVPSVRTDNKEAVKRLLRELAKKGCRSIGLISAESIATSSIKERYDGFFEAQEELQLAGIPDCIVEIDENILVHEPSEKNVKHIAEYLKKHGAQVDSILCTEYSIMSALKRAAETTGFDLSAIRLACVDGPAGFQELHMKQDEAAMARHVAELLMQRIEGRRDAWDTEDVIVPAILLEC